jgi:hypothetical protein
MDTWNIYYDEADSDKAPTDFIGIIEASTMSEALDFAAQCYEKPIHDLLAIRSDLEEPTLEKCPYCRGWHQSGFSKLCPLRPKT